MRFDVSSFVWKNSNYQWITGIWDYIKNETSAFRKSTKEIFQGNFHKNPVYSLQEFIVKHQLQTLDELFLGQVISKIFRQIRGNSLPNFLASLFISNEVMTTARGKNLTPNQYSRTKLKRKPLRISILKIYK